MNSCIRPLQAVETEHISGVNIYNICRSNVHLKEHYTDGKNTQLDRSRLALCARITVLVDSTVEELFTD